MDYSKFSNVSVVNRKCTDANWYIDKECAE